MNIFFFEKQFVLSNQGQKPRKKRGTPSRAKEAKIQMSKNAAKQHCLKKMQ